jgi:gamma-glutamyltranspeptidase
VLQPAIELAEQGFPVSPVTAHHWQQLLWQVRPQRWLHGAGLCLPPDGESLAASTAWLCWLRR